MVNRYSVGAKKRWSRVPPEERSEMMRKLALKRQRKMTTGEKKKHLAKMNKARTSG